MQAAGGGGMSAGSSAGAVGGASGSSIGGVNIDLSGRGDMNVTYLVGGALAVGALFIFLTKRK
ncbi:TMhelix containing protein [Vibrio phage 1.069.O._10N.286.49.F11]|uniref:TMhelix containing protein n=7 Tax=Autolykiviridae TaxID=2184034 RepID=A0A2I7S883_9VIRU|nr:TMhelix containing protein [Vibrio phage 1.008.O._10N.286.54.E5]AUR81643.1 TMhelix containing protein [Vibrio phage 1.011.O._10N.286.49.B11]AUR83782.1 TMhelix containing protein [Vibrio phage 1.040.O._10N.286.45.B9]AUR84661.1 TMhelix containing protein [Vibrio phage 1.062.O._10N.286.55.C3]AUR85158.1 TMhelix containing protein [Vibrio phage 1.069.O._10N.286.49.F11]AUR89586.1 TMhelix containing protein [Vibrio phage 1.125.O._10N.286.49.F5]AUS02075.1 TMhelix containing protein [Vibrio phage 2